ncbi:zinc finger protein [Macleaya cordata]|uniref:Zinc finger protein n=1 Tax=Macleaya cordata TaxID=56857 RepID=A0A200PVM4_MACCD|nr:zinc finger protein [Macleaya cordata]
MESLETAAWLVDDLLNFSSDIGEGEEEPKQEVENEDDENRNNKTTNNNNKKVLPSSLPLDSKPLKEEALPNIFDPDKENPFFPEFQEEELEWLSNENAFPSIETFLPMKPNNVMKHQSPVSIRLENSSSISCSSSSSSGIMSCCGTLQVPVRARSKRRRRRRSSLLELSGRQWTFWSEPVKKNGGRRMAKTTTGRKCSHCLSEKTPQWRAGPLGPKTLCNACGVRYKSGRLMPEYRPAGSPTFMTELHSNSHKKVLEMRRQKQKMMSQSLDTG